MKTFSAILLALAFLWTAANARADVGDPQIKTDHPWYPGELACSTFERLFATQAELYKRVVGKTPTTDEDKVLAAFLWRNTHFAHGEEGTEDLWGKGFRAGTDMRSREYWTGMFAHGFGLCGTTHAQWVAEMQALLGHTRGRAVGVDGHNSFEVFLTGGAYGKGKWALLDHDLSTVIYSPDGSAMLSLKEIQKDWKKLTDRKFAPDRQHGWLVCGLHPGDGGSYAQYRVAEYLAGYSGPPPMVHLRRGETLRRYLEPGLEDGKTYVFWGRNYNIGGVPGPTRSETWVNQPEKMYGSKTGTGHKPGQARFANAVYTYRPDFKSGDYKEGVLKEDKDGIVFSFASPYQIAATPGNSKDWGIYDEGCRNGLVLKGKADCPVAVSVDRGQTWIDCGAFKDGLDLTDHVKGRRQYLLRLQTKADNLKDAGLTMTTVCQANSSIIPRLKDNGSAVTFQSSGQAVVSAGPNVPQAQAHVIAGKFGTPAVTMAVATPNGEPITRVHAAAHVFSSNPPRPEIKYQIEFSTDEGKTWQLIVKDWQIERRGDDPPDFWSQSMCFGAIDLKGKADKVQVRYRNSGGKNYVRAEVHLAYRTPKQDATKVTFAWADDRGTRQDSHTFDGGSENVNRPATGWIVPTGANTRTRWVEYEPVTK